MTTITTDERLARREAMAELWKEGWTLAEIGEHYSLTRERVRQLLPEGVKRDMTVGAKRDKEWEAEHGDAVREAVSRFTSIADLAESLGLSRDRVARFLRDQGLKTREARKPKGLQFTDPYIKGLLQKAWIAAEKTGAEVLTGPFYEDWASDQDEAPTRVTVVKRFGTWFEACEAAGVPAGSRPRMRTVTEARCIDAVRIWIAASQSKPGGRVPNYDVFRSVRGDLPSKKSVIDRLGRWSTAVEAAEWYQGLLDAGLVKAGAVDLGPEPNHAQAALDDA